MEELNKIVQEIIEEAITLPNQAGREITVIKEQQATLLAEKNNVSLHEIYLTALKNNILPYRYIRNLESISIDDQLTLIESRVSIIGAGGLGGQVIVLLARLGVGNLAVIDHDVFDETNLNRQALSDTAVIGQSKAETAKAVAERINPSVNVTAYHSRLDDSNASQYLAGSNVIIDALDNIADRFVLEEYAKKLNTPMVHGAIAGFEGQIMTIFPGDTGMESIYGKKNLKANPEKSPVSILGVPTLTPAIIASYQAFEAMKVILEKGDVFRNMLVYFDLAKGEMRKLKFS